MSGTKNEQITENGMEWNTSGLGEWYRASFSNEWKKTNLMHLLYIFIVAVGDALHVSGVFAHHQER
jgi:hypothetical protein